MSTNWVADIAELHNKFGVREKVGEFDKQKLRAFLDFRIKFLQEELDELKAAKNADDVVDALIDLCVVAIGTLDVMQMNSYEAWNRVHAANMSKEVGIKASRPNPLGLPDLIKPDGWEAPEHFDNVGILAMLFDGEPEVKAEEPVEQPDQSSKETASKKAKKSKKPDEEQLVEEVKVAEVVEEVKLTIETETKESE